MALSDWDKKAQATFTKIIDAIPEPMRDTMKPQLMAMMEKKAAGAKVTNEVIEKMVREDLPEPQRSVIMGVLGLSDEASPPQTKDEGSPLTWEGDSEALVEKIMEVIPETLRGAVKPKFLDFIAKKAGGGGIVTEKLVSEAIQEMKPPEPFMSQIMELLTSGPGMDLGKVDNILSGYEGVQEELVSILHDLQREYSHLPKGALVKVSEFLSIPLSLVYRVATSYQAFSLEPREKHVVKVCDGFACHLNQADELYKALEQTSAGRFTVEKVRCIGCCGSEPMVMVDDECGDGAWARDKTAKF